MEIMAEIAVTGAAGNVGREVLDGFDDTEHESVAFTHSEHDDIDSETLDVTNRTEVLEKLDGFDVVIHLAGASAPDAEWETTVETNIQGTKHVFDAAVENSIDRVVFASSNHAVGMYNVADPTDTENMTMGHARRVDPDDPIRPDSFYGISKVAGEGLASYYADHHGIETVNLRIGWHMTRDALRERTGDGVAPEDDRFARAMWLSPRDCRDIHLKAATANLPRDRVTVNAVSRNDERFLSLTETHRTIGYEPRDNADEALAE
jgi:L-arabinose 1-dehydrogenase [NAD(P)+]